MLPAKRSLFPRGCVRVSADDEIAHGSPHSPAVLHRSAGSAAQSVSLRSCVVLCTHVCVQRAVSFASYIQYFRHTSPRRIFKFPSISWYTLNLPQGAGSGGKSWLVPRPYRTTGRTTNTARTNPAPAHSRATRPSIHTWEYRIRFKGAPRNERNQAGQSSQSPCDISSKPCPGPAQHLLLQQGGRTKRTNAGAPNLDSWWEPPAHPP